LDAYKGSARYTEYIKRLKDLKRDSVDIKVRAKDYKALDSGKGEVAHISSQKGQRIGALVLKNIVKAFLFTLLSNY
jgi:hypothetical protein